MVSTGLATIATAPIGGFAYNHAAITAALNANEHAHKEPKKRYLASVYGGVVYVLLALFAVPFMTFVRLPAVVTFLVGASGFSVWGVGAAFWALVTGVLVWLVLKKRA